MNRSSPSSPETVDMPCNLSAAAITARSPEVVCRSRPSNFKRLNKKILARNCKSDLIPLSRDCGLANHRIQTELCNVAICARRPTPFSTFNDKRPQFGGRGRQPLGKFCSRPGLLAWDWSGAWIRFEVVPFAEQQKRPGARSTSCCKERLALARGAAAAKPALRPWTAVGLQFRLSSFSSASGSLLPAFLQLTCLSHSQNGFARESATAFVKRLCRLPQSTGCRGVRSPAIAGYAAEAGRA